MVEDLAYIAANTFEFLLQVNPQGYDSAARYMEHLGLDADDWLDPEQEAQARATGRWVLGQIYPAGQVGFFFVAGTDPAAIISRCAELLRDDLAGYASQGLTPVAIKP